jgi:hypothetical protein
MKKIETAYYPKYTRERNIIFDEKTNSPFINKNIQFRYLYFFLNKQYIMNFTYGYFKDLNIFFNILILDRILDIIFSFFPENFV